MWVLGISVAIAMRMTKHVARISSISPRSTLPMHNNNNSSNNNKLMTTRWYMVVTIGYFYLQNTNRYNGWAIALQLIIIIIRKVECHDVSTYMPQDAFHH